MTRLLLFLLLIGLSTGVYSQASVTASASVTILKPISISKKADLNFAEVVVHEADGAVVLSPDSSRTISGGAGFPTQSSQSASAASFVIEGEESEYSITMPEEILLSDGSRSLKVNHFTHDSAGKLLGGTETVHIGATLHVHGNQEPGTYQSHSDLRVTVQYK